MWAKGLHSICNISTRGLPDMYTLSPQTLWLQGAHIRQTTNAHVTYTKCTFPFPKTTEHDKENCHYNNHSNDYSYYYVDTTVT